MIEAVGATETFAPSEPFSSNGELDKEAFLQLLTTQLRFQDPLNPASQEDMLGVLADMSSLEQMTNVNQGLTNLLQSDRLDLIGKEVSALTETGVPIEGVVEAIRFQQDGALMTVNGFEVSTDNIIQVRLPK